MKYAILKLEKNRVISFHLHFIFLATMIVICSFKNYLIENVIMYFLNVLPKTNEDYISVTYCCIRFIDRFSFLQESRDKLVKTLK